VAPAKTLMPRVTLTNRWVLNLVLAAVVLGLAALVYFRPEPQAPPGPPLTTLSAADVQRIRIDRGGETVVLEKSSSGWRLQAPITARANEFNVASLLRVTSTSSSFQTAVDTAALATYGLDKPQLRLQLNDEEITVGALHPLRQQHYVRYREQVQLIPSSVLAAAFQHYSNFIDTRLLEDGRKLRELRLPSLRLVQRDGTWQREPAVADAELSVDRLNDLVAEWENARALSVQKLSARAPEAQVQLVFDAEPSTLTLAILAYKPELILARRDEGLEYHFPEDVGKRLLSLTAE
jgi:hypothetical protein